MASLTLDSSLAAEAAVTRAAALARVALPAGRTTELAAFLRAELDTLSRALGGARPGPDGIAVGVGAGGMPLRTDGGAQYAMARPLALVAPMSRLGYVLVPRLAAEPTPGAAGAARLDADVIADDAFTAELAVGA